MNVVRIGTIIFRGKQNLPWKEVEQYMKRYAGQAYVVKEYGDTIRVNSLSANEFTESTYTKKLRGALAKVKANTSQVIPQLIENAFNKRWVENKNPKHSGDASLGWYRYDTMFSVPVKADNEDQIRWNCYRGTIVVKINNRGLFFYDLIDIKKEARTP